MAAGDEEVAEGDGYVGEVEVGEPGVGARWDGVEAAFEGEEQVCFQTLYLSKFRFLTPLPLLL